MLYLIFAGRISVGEFFSLFIYSFFIFGPLQELGNIINIYRETEVSLDNFKGILNTPKEKKQLGELLNLTWGFGIEHEMQIYHIPPDDYSKNIIDFILFDAKSAVDRVIKSYKKGEIELTNEEFDFIQNMVFETSGRKCSGKWIVKAPPYEMPEFITWKPFCNMRTGRNIHNLTKNVQYVKDIFFEIILTERLYRK
jgi:ABC-type multidrug transport system fused ATPase/permease subunit